MDSQPIDNLFEQHPVTDSRIRKYEISRFPSLQQMPSTGPNLPEITIDARGAGMDSLALLERAFLGVKVTQYASSANGAAAVASQLIQNGWSLFQRTNLYVSDSEVEQVDRPGIVSHFKRLVEWSADAVYGQGPSASDYPQQTSVLEPIFGNVAAAADDPNVEKGLTRYGTVGTPGTQYLRLQLRDIFGFCNIDKGLIGAGVKLRLQPETSFERVVRGAADSTVAFICIESVDLYLPLARPDNSTLSHIYKEIKSGKTIPYEFERWNYYPVDILNGSTAENVVIPNFGKRPTTILVGMQLATAQNTFTVDKLATRLFGLTTHRLMVDSKVYPEIGYEGSSFGYLHEYETFLQVGNKHKTDAFGTFVDFDKWKNVYPILAYDVSATRDEFGSVRSNPPVIRWTCAHSNPASAALAHIVVVGKEVKNLNIVNDIMLVSAPEYQD